MVTPTRVKMPSATSIVARSIDDHVIGIENRLPWHLRTDLKLFRERTTRHALIMGRRTYDSIGKPLPNRLNIVLSRQEVAESINLRWAPDVFTALQLADTHAICNMQSQFFVIGGERIYREFSQWINKVWLTEVDAGRINGDAKFDFDFPSVEWWRAARKSFPATADDQFAFEISCWLRRKPEHRKRLRAELLAMDHEVISSLDRWLEGHDNGGVTVTPEEQLVLFPG